MKSLVVGVIASCLVASPTSALISRKSPTRAPQQASSALFLAPEALTEYMGKAHEDKLKAVQEVEKKKNAEIQVTNFKYWNTRRQFFH